MNKWMNECAYSKKPIQKSTHKNMHLKKKKKGNTNMLQVTTLHCIQKLLPELRSLVL